MSCQQPLFCLRGAKIETVTKLSQGKHTKLLISDPEDDTITRAAMVFGCRTEDFPYRAGDLVDLAYTLEVNEFRGERTVQMNIIDIRPACNAEVSPEMSGYHALRRRQITPEMAEELIPDRATLALVWRYLASAGDCVRETPMCLCRKIVRWSDKPLSLGKLLTCLDIFADVGLLEVHRLHKNLTIRPTPGSGKADLNESTTMQILLQAKES